MKKTIGMSVTLGSKLLPETQVARGIAREACKENVWEIPVFKHIHTH